MIDDIKCVTMEVANVVGCKVSFDPNCREITVLIDILDGSDFLIVMFAVSKAIEKVIPVSSYSKVYGRIVS